MGASQSKNHQPLVILPLRSSALIGKFHQKNKQSMRAARTSAARAARILARQSSLTQTEPRGKAENGPLQPIPWINKKADQQDTTPATPPNTPLMTSSNEAARAEQRYLAMEKVFEQAVYLDEYCLNRSRATDLKLRL